MATLAELDLAGDLWKVDLELAPDEQELRLVYASPRLKTWLTETLPQLGSTWAIEITPQEQVDALLVDFCLGEEIVYERMFRNIRPVGDGVWELKTADIRIFGWFCCKDVFVGHCADTAERIKEYNLYYGYRGEVVRFRDELGLDSPKFVPGEDPNAVVSNVCFA